MERIKAYDMLMETGYQRCKSNTPFDKNAKPFSKDFLENILRFLEENERYEDCVFMKNFIDKRYNHELNFKI
jgi:hypothetical protein